MAEFTIGAQWMSALEWYFEGLAMTTQEAASSATDYLHTNIVDYARQHDRWNVVADHIEVWSEDGQLVIGVRDSEFVSQAEAIEYGDEVTPPDPLFRVLAPMASGAGDQIRERFLSNYGGQVY